MIKGSTTNHCNTCSADIRGMCCWYSYYDGTDNFVIYPCEYLSKKTRRCTIYKNRFKINEKCLTVDQALREGAFPKECPYVIESSITPIRPHKTVNIKKVRLLNDELKKRRFQEVPNC
jgi:uncharacterized cysteine cluster protein YcgN (CxxCxxCC family)